MYESLSSQFFTTTNGIQLGPDNFDESMFFMTFLIIPPAKLIIKFVKNVCNSFNMAMRKTKKWFLQTISAN